MTPNLLSRLPFPLAQVCLRARNAKSWAEKHHNAYYLLEAAVKWMASVAAAQYLREEGGRTKKADEALKALALPSTGQWVQILRTLADHFARRVDAASHPLGPWSQALLDRRPMPMSASFLGRLSELDGVETGAGSSLAPMDLFNALPAYRNKHLGHGALAKESFYNEMAPVLLEAATEVLCDLDLLAKGECVFVEEKRETGDGSTVVERIRLVGALPMRMDPLVLRAGEACPHAPGRLCLDWGAGVEPLPLFPLLHSTWHEEQAEVFFLNRSLRGDTPEYLSYASGRVLKGEGFEEEFRSFLSLIVRKSVDSREERRLREKSLSDGEGEAEPLPEGVQRLGHFRLYGELGKGGMGVVYLAEQESLHRLVALKTLPFEKGRDPVRQARFLREIQSLSRTESSNVVKILDSGEERGVLWYAMELVDGAELSDLIAELRKVKEEKKRLRGSDLWAAIHECLRAERNRRRALLGLDALPDTAPPPVPEHLRPYANKHAGMSLAVLMEDASRALQHIHEQERPVIHRDIKPANLMVTAEGRLVLMDFGLARTEGGTTLTVADTVLGTIRYAPPEQIRRMAKVDTRADIYSLGATFHELATLGPLYDADSEVELISKITDETSKPTEIHILDTDFPDDLSIILQKCVLKDPGQRYGSAKELNEDLQRFLGGNPILARKPSFRYYAKMFARKHRAALSVAGVSFLLLVALLIAYNIKIVREKNRATARYLLSQALLNAGNDKSPAYLAAALRMAPGEISSRAAQEGLDATRDNFLSPHQLLEESPTAIRKIVFSPDGSLLARASWDNTVRIWNLKTGESRVSEGHQAQVYDLAFSPSGHQLASASEDGTVRLWDLRANKSRVLNSQKCVCWRLAFSPDGVLLASSSSDKAIHLWDVKTGNDRILEGHEGAINDICFSPDGTLLASASEDRTVRLWDVMTGDAIVLRGHSEGINKIAFSPKGNMLASASSDKTVRLWDVGTRKDRILAGHEARVQSVAFSPDGSLLGSASDDKTIRLWDVRTGESRVLKGHEDGVRIIAFSPDGSNLASGSLDCTVRLWNAQGCEVGILKGHSGPIYDFAYSPDGALLASVSIDGTLRLWRVMKMPIRSLTGCAEEMRGLTFSPDGELLAGASVDKTIHLWNVLTGETWALKGHEDEVNTVDFSPNGFLLASGSSDKTVRLWDVRTGDCRILRCYKDPVWSVAFSPDGRSLAICPQDRTIHLWNLAAGETRILEGHRGLVFALAFSPDGSSLASAATDRPIRLWDVQTGTSRLLKTNDSGVGAIAFSPDGAFLASGHLDKTVRFWNVKTGQITRQTVCDEPILDIAFSPDGSFLAGVLYDRTARLWDLKSGRSSVLKGQGIGFEIVAFSPRGTILALATTDNTVRLWSPLPKFYFPSQSKPVWVLCALPMSEILHALDSVSNLRYDAKTDTVKPLPFTGIPKEWVEETRN